MSVFERMVENDYSIPSYMADVFDSILLLPDKQHSRIYTIDWEMVCSRFRL